MCSFDGSRGQDASDRHHCRICYALFLPGCTPTRPPDSRRAAVWSTSACYLVMFAMPSAPLVEAYIPQIKLPSGGFSPNDRCTCTAQRHKRSPIEPQVLTYCRQTAVPTTDTLMARFVPTFLAGGEGGGTFSGVSGVLLHFASHVADPYLSRHS